jgi:Flp pilus assembly protein TadG
MHNFFPQATTNKNTNNRAGQRRRGNILVIVAASFIGLLGFSALAVDYGVSVTEKQRLQRACDAAALAGASQLKQTPVASSATAAAIAQANATDAANAITQARANATRNNMTLADSDMTFPSASGTQLRVTKVAQRRFLFANYIHNVSASALAGRSYVIGLKGLTPWA